MALGWSRALKGWGRWLAFVAGVSAAILLLMVAKPAQGAAAPAKSADDFVDSMCVGTHWHYTDTVYGQRYDEVRDKLAALGIRHVRDSGSDDDYINKTKELAALGIKTTLVLDPNIGTKPNASYWGNPPNYLINDFVKNKVGTDAIDAVEMHNEMDLSYGNERWYPGDTTSLSNDPSSSRYWVKYIQAATRDTYAALKNDPDTANIPVYGPSLTSQEAYATVGDLSSSIDASTVHWYLAGRNPETGGWGPNGYGSRAYTIDYLAHKQSPSDPVVATEGGYSNAVNQNDMNTSEEVTARYLPRLFLYAFNGGFQRFCSYELVDEWPNPQKDDAEKNFGLLRNDLSEKPAYTALKNLIDLLKDPGPSFTPGSLDYSLSGDTDGVQSTLLQKRDGSFYLVLWVGKPSYDPTNGQTIDVPDQRVTLNLNQPVDEATTYLPNDSASPTNQYTSPTQLNLDVPDEPLIVELKPSGSSDSGGTGSGTGTCATGQFQAEYFANKTLDGEPTFEDCEGGINHDWGQGGPGNGVGPDNFSARWTGEQNFESGNYTFTATADDGIRVWVDGEPIIDEWKDQAETTYTATRAMTAGEHEVKVEYYDYWGQATAQVSWQKANDGGSKAKNKKHKGKAAKKQGKHKRR